MRWYNVSGLLWLSSNAKSFDWEELTRLAHRALPTTDEDPEANDCEAQLPALRDAPLATHPPQEALQGYLPERLRPGQHVRGFQLTSFVRRIPLLPPIAVPASTTDVTRSTALQVMQSRDNNAELPLGDLALPGKFRDETLALPSPPSAALVLFDPATSMAVETAVLDSLLALPPATTQSIGMTPTAVGTEVALARVRPASLSPAEQTWVDEQMLAKVESESSVKRQRRAATVSMESAHESSGDGVPGYNMGDRIGHGHHGEVWRAVRARQSSDSSSSDRNTERNQDDAREKREQYVLKRIFVEKGLDIRLSGLREVYFGELLKPLALTSVARYVEWFERIDDSKKGEGRREVWIVFVDEGNSLHNLLYTDDAEADARDNDVDLHGQKISRSRSKLTSKGTLGDQRMAEGKQDQSAERTDRDEEEGTRPEGTPASDGVSVVAPSRLWHAIKADMVHADGEAMREVLRQVLVALAEVHQEGRVIHRDIKPENMIVALNVHHRHKQDHNGEYDGPRDNTNDAGQSGGAGTNRGSTPLIRLADFGSAYSEEMPKELWPPPHRRPSRAEETTDYSPPEVLFHPLIGTLEKDNDGDGEHNVRRGVPYDIWSVGVTWLELITGARNTTTFHSSRHASNLYCVYDGQRALPNDGGWLCPFG